MAGCGSSKKSSSSSTPIAVQVDSKSTAFNFASTAYYPNEIQVHAGDTVRFTSVFTGEPHTVTLGTLVQQGLDAYDQAAKTNPQVDDHTIPQLAKIPDLLPQGPGDANQAVAQPCFVDSGDPPGPGATPCPKRAQPDFTGTQTLYNSGFLPDGATFNVKLAKNIKPGTYRWFCSLHRSAMQGKLTVVKSSTKLPTAAELKQQGDQQLQKRVQGLQPVVSQAASATASDKAVAGLGSQQVQDAFAAVMEPKTISVKTGGSVTWTIFGPHTVSFGVTEDVRTFIAKAPDGAVHLNPKSFAPAGGEGQPQGPPPTAPGPPIPINGGTFDGTGFHSSGIVLSFPPQLFTYKLTFTKPGSYKYACLIHPDMEGTVQVG